MKNAAVTFSVLLSILSTSNAYAKQLSLKSVKTIVCQSTFYYEEESPMQKTKVEGIKIFTRGSRSDVKPAAGAFLLSEFNLNENGNLAEYGNQQFYFGDVKDGKVAFEFLADWKASGELNLRADGTADGFINQKTHVTDIRCILK